MDVQAELGHCLLVVVVVNLPRANVSGPDVPLGNGGAILVITDCSGSPVFIVTESLVAHTLTSDDVVGEYGVLAIFLGQGVNLLLEALWGLWEDFRGRSSNGRREWKEDGRGSKGNVVSERCGHEHCPHY